MHHGRGYGRGTGGRGSGNYGGRGHQRHDRHNGHGRRDPRDNYDNRGGKPSGYGRGTYRRSQSPDARGNLSNAGRPRPDRRLWADDSSPHSPPGLERHHSHSNGDTYSFGGGAVPPQPDAPSSADNYAAQLHRMQQRADWPEILRRSGGALPSMPPSGMSSGTLPGMPPPPFPPLSSPSGGGGGGGPSVPFTPFTPHPSSGPLLSSGSTGVAPTFAGASHQTVMSGQNSLRPMDDRSWSQWVRDGDKLLSVLLEAGCLSFDQFHTALSSFVTPIGLHSVLFGAQSQCEVLWRHWYGTNQLPQWDMRLRHLSLLIAGKFQPYDLNTFNQAVALALARPDAWDQLFAVCAGWRAVTARYELLKVEQLPLLEAEVIKSMCWRFTSQSFQQYRHNLHPKITQLLRLDSARDRTPSRLLQL